MCDFDVMGEDGRSGAAQIDGDRRPNPDGANENSSGEPHGGECYRGASGSGRDGDRS